METNTPTKITVQNLVHAPLAKVWELWVTPAHITQWNNASPDWHTPKAQNDLREGGTFIYRMEAKDGSFGFDFKGVYTQVTPQERLTYVLEDGRQVEISFVSQEGQTHVVEIFEPENQNPLELQQTGWQAILDNFKQYAESQA